MSKDISIKVNGVAQEIDAADTVRVKGVTQSRVDFVPEDECTVKGKFITANGTYTAANDGALGYKKVAVMDVASVGADETVSGAKSVKVAITEGGTARAMSKVKKLQVNALGGGNVLLLPKPNLKGTTLHVTKPGLYDVKDEADADVYTSVTVNVSDADRDAAGFNPSNPTWQDNLPDEIRVTTPPTKTEYAAGEEIDYTGMIVKAYKNGTVWSNNNYPDGVIPLEELILQHMDDTTAYIPSDAPHNIYYKMYMDGEICPAKELEMTHETWYIWTSSNVRIYLYGVFNAKISNGLCTAFGINNDSSPSRKTIDRIIYAAKYDQENYPELSCNTVFEARREHWPDTGKIYQKEEQQYSFSAMDDSYTNFGSDVFSDLNRKYFIGSESLYSNPRYKYTLKNKTVVYSVCQFNSETGLIYKNNWKTTNIEYKYVKYDNWTNVDNGIIAWYLIYGERTAKISWERPGDKLELTTWQVMTYEN